MSYVINKAEELPARSIGRWMIRVVRIFDCYGWIAEHLDTGLVRYSHGIFSSGDAAMSDATGNYFVWN